MCVLFFVKQKTAYEMRISDWSSDVCSSDLNRLEITSPGGFPDGVTAENIIYRQHPRNRRIAEALQFCGLVERSGQGADRMFRMCIQEGKNRQIGSASCRERVCQYV